MSPLSRSFHLMPVRLAALVLAGGVGMGWPILSIAQKPKQAETRLQFSNTPFDYSITRLTPGYRGIDALQLSKALSQNPFPTRRKFETTGELEQRQRVWTEGSLLGAITPNSLLAFGIVPSNDGDVSIVYDADKAEMVIKISPRFCGGLNKLTLSSATKRLGSYLGTNVFGVKRMVMRSRVASLCLDGLQDIEVRFPVTRDSAPIKRQNARVLLIGTLTAPYIDTTEDYSTPEFDAPSEVQFTFNVLKFRADELWVYNASTGEILYRPHEEAGFDQNGNDALHLAIWAERTYAALALIKKVDTDINHRNKFGATPLHLAVAKRDRKVIDALILAGADQNIRDNDGVTPLEDAKKSGFSDIVELLR